MDTPYTTGQGVQTPFNQTPANVPAPAPAVPGPPSLPLDVMITRDYATGVKPEDIIDGLLQTKTAGPQVEADIQKGIDTDKIIEKWGGKPLQAFKASDPAEKVKAQSFLTNLGQGASSAYDDLTTGAAQLIDRVTGDKANLQRLQDVQKAKDADPANVALNNTVGGTVGNVGVKALPYLGAAALTDGASIPAMIGAQTATGAGMGALKPTTDPNESVVGNMAKEGGMAALGSGAGIGLGKLVGAGSKLLAPSAENTERLAAAQAAGLPVTPAMANTTVRNLVRAVPSASEAMDSQATKALSRQLLAGIDQTGDAITPQAIESAKGSIYTEANKLLAPVTVKPDPALATKLETIANDYTRKAGLPSSDVTKFVQNANVHLTSGTASGEDIVNLAREARDASYGTTGTTQKAFKSIADSLNDHLEAIAPEARQALRDANLKYQNLKTVENVYSRANGQPFSAQQLAQSVKQAGKYQYTTGKAPYQDLADNAITALGKDNSHSLTGKLTKSAAGVLDTTGHAGGLALVMHNPVLGGAALGGQSLAKALVKKLATSENPTLVRLLSGVKGASLDPATKAKLISALSATGGATGGNQ